MCSLCCPCRYERNFHFFYNMLKGVTADKELGALTHLTGEREREERRERGRERERRERERERERHQFPIWWGGVMRGQAFVAAPPAVRAWGSSPCVPGAPALTRGGAFQT